MPDRALIALCLFCPLAACTLPVAPAVEGDPAAARTMLEAVATSGPVPLVVTAAPADFPPETVAAAIARGIRGLEVRFAPAAGVPPNALLASLTEVRPERLCREGAAAATGPTSTLVLVWCGQEEVVAAVEQPLPALSPEAVKRALWRAAARLFPDRYPERYGIDLFGFRVSVSASVGF